MQRLRNRIIQIKENFDKKYIRIADHQFLKKNDLIQKEPLNFLINRTNIHKSDIEKQEKKFSDFKWPIFMNHRYN